MKSILVMMALFSMPVAHGQAITQWGPLPSQDSAYAGPVSLDSSLVPGVYAIASWVSGNCAWFMGLRNGDLLGSCSYHRGQNEVSYANVRWRVSPDNTTKAIEAIPCSQLGEAADAANRSAGWEHLQGCFKYPK